MAQLKTLGLAASKSLPEIAEEMGVSKQYIQQVERSALKKLRIILDERGIDLADLIPERAATDNDALLIRRSSEKLPHTLPPRIHAFTPIALPDFPLPKE